MTACVCSAPQMPRATASLASRSELVNCGMATAARMPMTTMTTMSSMRVKPRCANPGGLIAIGLRKTGRRWNGRTADRRARRTAGGCPDHRRCGTVTTVGYGATASCRAAARQDLALDDVIGSRRAIRGIEQNGSGLQRAADTARDGVLRVPFRIRELRDGDCGKDADDHHHDDQFDQCETCLLLH